MDENSTISTDKNVVNNTSHEEICFKPLLRFKEFNSEWELIKLNEFLEFINTNSLSRSKLNFEKGSLKNIHYGDIHTKFPTLIDCSVEEIPYICPNIDISKFKDEQYCKNGDLIIADASEDYEDIGKSVELININEEIVSGLHTILARDKNNKTALGFKGYLFLNESLRKDIKIIANGVSVLGISKNNLANLEVKLPSLEEQRKIVSFLSAIDKKIVLCKKTLSLYQKHLTGTRLNLIENYKDLNKVRLKNICYINKGIQLNKLDMIENGKYYVLNGGKKPSGFTDSWNVNENTITISEGGYCGYVFFNTEKFYCGGHCYYLTPKSDSFDLKYLYHYLKSNEKEIMKLGVGSGIKNIQKKDAENINVYLPNYNEQVKIGKFCDFLELKIEYTNKKLIQLNSFKKGLLENMFI